MPPTHESRAAPPPPTPLLSCPMPLADSLKDFALEEVLAEDAEKHSVVLLGRLGTREGQAIVMLAKRHFDVATLGERVCTEATRLESVFDNDVYHKFVADLDPDLTRINAQIIYPATERHVAKYRKQRFHVLAETPELYRAVVEPYIASIPPSRIEWVYNMLAKEKEADRMLTEDPDAQVGFVLHPDLKWDQVNMDGLYCLAIVHRRDLRSLRDLRSEHVPLLENVRDKGAAAIQQHFGVARNRLRIFLHYHPSYYHLHVHFVHVENTAPGAGLMAGKAHLLDDVVANLALASDYYAKRTLHAVLGENDPLTLAIRKHSDAP